MPAILFGSISTVADTSELQRNAFNEAFATHGLDWKWDRDDYRDLLDSGSGGQQRIANYASSLGQTVDAAAVHETKSAIFQQSLGTSQVQARPGVVDTIRAAKDSGLKVGLVSLTSRQNIDALMQALAPSIDAADFDIVLDSSSVEKPKPDGGAYSFALESLDESPGGCIAIEDNVQGVDAAVAAGLRCVAFPNENTAGHAFGSAVEQVDRVDFAALQQLMHTV